MEVKHRIRELREKRGWSQAYLGSLIGRSKSVISRIEDGGSGLDLYLAAKIADAFQTTLADVLALDEPAGPGMKGFSENEFSKYVAGPGDPFKKLETSTKYLMVIDSDALTKHGIRRGDVALVDGSDAICKSPPALAPVRVQFHPDPERPNFAVTLLRQFVPPSLLITNSLTHNMPSIDLDSEDAQILGVIVWSSRRHA